MAKKYKLRPTGRKYARPVRAQTRMNPYRARPGLNTLSSARSRYFTPLPKMMQVKLPWFADCKYVVPFAQTGNTLAGVACAYWFIDPLDLSQSCSSTGLSDGQKYFFCGEQGVFMSLYQEGRFRTHSMNVNFSAEVQTLYVDGSSVSTLNTKHTTVLHVAVASVPLTYLKKNDNSPHIIGDAGAVFQGVDYYAALSQQPGCKQLVIPLDGSLNSLKSARIDMDAYEHNGSAQLMRSVSSWPETADYPTITIAYPAPAARNVILFAVRVASTPITNRTNTLYVRCEYRLDQHIVFCDKFPSFPYVTTGVA